MTYDYIHSEKGWAIPEYGRNGAEKMVDHIKTIQDRDERNRAARTIDSDHGQSESGSCVMRVIFRTKTWDHLHFIEISRLDN